MQYTRRLAGFGYCTELLGQARWRMPVVIVPYGHIMTTRSLKREVTQCADGEARCVRHFDGPDRRIFERCQIVSRVSVI